MMLDKKNSTRVRGELELEVLNFRGRFENFHFQVGVGPSGGGGIFF